MKPILALLFTALLFLPLVGCLKQPLHDVEGEITLDGKPIDVGHLVFFGKNGKGRKEGARIEAGRYSGRAASGNNLVKVQGFAHLEKPIPDPEFPGSFITTKKVTDDALHWDNENLILDMSPHVRDIRLTSDPASPVIP